MLQNDFFSFTAPQTEGNTARTMLTLNATHDIFKGHFPQHPIVPGVCMMQMVKEVVESAIGKETNLSIAHNIKFLTIIDPRENPQVQLEYKFVIPEEGAIHVDAQLLNGGTVFFKFKGTFTQV